MPLLPPADPAWERSRPARLTVLAALSYVLLMATIWVQSHDPEVRAAASDPRAESLAQTGPSWVVLLGFALLYAALALAVRAGVPVTLHVMAALMVAVGIVLLLSSGTGFLWNWRVGVVPLAGFLVNLAWLVVAYRRDRFAA